MTTIPLGAVFNLISQVVSLGLIVVGLRFAIRTHSAYSSGNAAGPRYESIHRNLMTSAVFISGLGTVIWMVPNFLLGWFYGPSSFGYGTGGYSSYFSVGGVYYAHWYLLLLMVVVGSVSSFLAVYLVLRMRWSRFPERLKVTNFRRVMVATWGLWLFNIMIGFLVFYFFVVAGTG